MLFLIIGRSQLNRSLYSVPALVPVPAHPAYPVSPTQPSVIVWFQPTSMVQSFSTTHDVGHSEFGYTSFGSRIFTTN